MRIAERTSRVMNKVYDRMRHRGAFTVRADDAVAGPFDPLRGHKYAVLVTFRRNGEAMPSPVWFAVGDDGNAYLRTLHDSGKVKRIRNDPRAVIVASNFRGKPIGTRLLGTALVLPEDEWPRAEAALVAAYGLGRKLYEGSLPGADEFSAYIEIRPTSAG